MILTITAFIVSAILFIVISQFLDGLWIYYVPASLILLSLYLKLIQPAWNENRFKMKSTKIEPSAAAGWIAITSIIYGIISIVFGNWILVVLCLGIFILSLTMKFPHSY